MNILFVHQNFPAQFGHIARHLAARPGYKCAFVSQTPEGVVDGVEKIRYEVRGGATDRNHYCSRTFENAVWHSEAVLEALRKRSDLRPDLVVAHSGFGSSLFLREIYGDTPIINLFEYFYRAHDPDSDMDFRSDLGWPTPPVNYLRARCRNAMILLDLDNCDAGYCPTDFQRTRFPDFCQPKLRTLFDGIDRSVYHGHHETLRPPPAQRSTRQVLGVEVPPEKRVVTYVSRGFEALRGFDIFMRTARLIAREDPNVIFFVVGDDRIAYGGDTEYIKPARTFKEWVLSRDDYDLSRFVFTGRIPPAHLARLLALTDLHIYLTAPFVLSWSMMDAMSCGAVVLGSRTPPVEEMIQDGKNGLLADFFSPEEFAEKAVAVLKDPDAYRPLGRAAEQQIIERYSLEAVLPRMLSMYEQAASRRSPLAPSNQTAPISETPEDLLTRSVKLKNRSPFLG